MPKRNRHREAVKAAQVAALQRTEKRTYIERRSDEFREQSDMKKIGKLLEGRMCPPVEFVIKKLKAEMRS